MWMVVVGVVFLVMKWAEVGPGANWPWWAVLTPFGLAVLWWAWADKTGWTKRREIDKMEARKTERRSKNLVALGIDPRTAGKVKEEHKKSEAFKSARQKEIARVEDRRAAIRQKNKDSIIASKFDSSMQDGDEVAEEKAGKR